MHKGDAGEQCAFGTLCDIGKEPRTSIEFRHTNRHKNSPLFFLLLYLSHTMTNFKRDLKEITLILLS